MRCLRIGVWETSNSKGWCAISDIVITPANISANYSIPGILPTIITANLGETATQGMSVYKKTDGTIWKSNAITSALTAAGIGITLSSGLAGQPVTYLSNGPMNFGAILTAGKWYVVSGTASGGICLTADLTSTWFSTLLMYAYSTSVGVIPAQGPIVTGIILA
jgi:hypothetical protein